MKLIKGLNLQITATAVIASILLYLFADKQITLFFAPYKDGSVYNIFKIITYLGKAEYTLVPSALVYLYTRKSRPDIARAAGAVFISVAVAGLSADVIKFFVGRMRPILLLKEGLYGFNPFHYKYEYVSFPSGHTADIFGAVSLLILWYRRYAIPLLGVGVLVGLSRVITLNHYTSDVVMGAFVGYLSALIIFNKMSKKNEKTSGI